VFWGYFSHANRFRLTCVAPIATEDAAAQQQQSAVKSEAGTAAGGGGSYAGDEYEGLVHANTGSGLIVLHQ